jgi:hypothetical protein
LVPEATDSIDPPARQTRVSCGSHLDQDACRATCPLAQAMKPNRSVQLMLTVRVGKVNAGGSGQTGVSTSYSRNQLILNDKILSA